MADYRYTDEDCLNALRAATEYFGRSPPRRKYEAAGFRPSASVIANRFGCWSEAKRTAGIPVTNGGRPPKPVRSDFFEAIDTETTAYWLGMLFGDGSLVEREHGHRVQLTQQASDADRLRAFKRTVRAENEIIEDGDARHIRIGDPEFVANLMEHNFTTTKGFDGTLPALHDWSLRRGFVRGLSDADGYVGEHKWTITDGNARRLRALQSWIPFDADIVDESYGERSWSYLRVSRVLPALYHWLYPERERTEPALPRKRKTAVSVVDADTR